MAQVLESKSPLEEPTEELTILLLGTDPLSTSLASALEESGHDVEISETKNAVEMVTITAPDLVLLVGDAARQGGKEILLQLAEHDSTWVTPVIVIGTRRSDDKSSNYRHGVIAFLSKTLGVKRLTARVLEIIAKLPDRAKDVSGEVSYEKIIAIIDDLKDKRRSGVLSVDIEGETEATSLVLRAGLPISESTSNFIDRIKSKLAGGKSAHYRFIESDSSRIDSLSPPKPEDIQSLPMLQKRRLLVVDSEYKRANTLSDALQLAGAQVVVLTPQTTDFKSASQIDPEVVLIDPKELTGPCRNVMDTIQQDRRMRWAAKLLAPHGEVWPEEAKQPHLGPIAARIAKLIKPAEHLESHVLSNQPFDTRLEILGPGRMLRILAEIDHDLKVQVHHPRLNVEIELIDGRIRAANGFDLVNRSPLDSMAALSALLVINSGRIHVERLKPDSRLFDVGVGDAFTEAAAEQPPIRPSLMTIRGKKEIKATQAIEPEKDVSKILAPQPIGLFSSTTKKESPPSIGQVAPKAQKNEELVPTLKENGLGFEPVSTLVQQSDQSSERAITEKSIEADSVTSKDSNQTEEQKSDNARMPPSFRPQLISGMISEVVAPKQESHSNLEVMDLIESIKPSPVHAPAFAMKSSLGKLQESMGVLFARTSTVAAGPIFGNLKTSMSAAMSRTRGLAMGPTVGKLWISTGENLSRLRTLVIKKSPGFARQKTIAIGIVCISLIMFLALKLSSSDKTAEEKVLSKNTTDIKTPSAVSAKNKKPEPIPAQQSSENEPPVELDSSKSGEKEVIDVQLDEKSGDENSETKLSSTADTDREKSSKESSLEKARLLVNKALRFRRQNRLGMAETYYLKALRVRPTYPRAMSGIVRIHLERKDGTEALRWAKRVVALQPNSSYNYLLLGDAYALSGKKKRARKAWRLAARRGNKRAKKRLSNK